MHLDERKVRIRVRERDDGVECHLGGSLPKKGLCAMRLEADLSFTRNLPARWTSQGLSLYLCREKKG